MRARSPPATEMRAALAWLRGLARAPHREDSSLSEPLLAGAPQSAASGGSAPRRGGPRARFVVCELDEGCEATVTLYVGDESVVIARRDGSVEIPFAAVEAWAMSRRICVLCATDAPPRCFLFATLAERVGFHRELWRRASPSDVYVHTGTLCARAIR